MMIDTFQNPSDETITSYLESSKTIAVVGLSDRQTTAAYDVARFMQAKGYRIVPVNPRLAGQSVLGEVVYASLAAIPFKVDIANVFRRSEYLPQVAQDFLACQGQVFWAQLGLYSQEAEELLRSAGKADIVMNRCIKIDYLRLISKQDQDSC